MRKLICKILTLGRHWWVYIPIGNGTIPVVHCWICKKKPANMWEIYCRKFRNKSSGMYEVN
jgi:hypothetical protein